MERVHELVAAGKLDAENAWFWSRHWHHIASAKVSLETKIAAYNALKLRSRINNIYVVNFYEMVRADRAFVAKLRLNIYRQHCYRVISMWLDDDVTALASYSPSAAEDKTVLWSDSNDEYSEMRDVLRYILRRVNAPQCLRFLFQDKAFREWVMKEQMSPLILQLAEDFVQPTDRLDRRLLLWCGQSVKLIGMFVKDEELVATWFRMRTNWQIMYLPISVSVARKLHALATPDQREEIKTEVLRVISEGESRDGVFELAWLCGLLGPSYPKVQECFRNKTTDAFPAFTFAMIVAMCDGYLEATSPRITTPQGRFFTLVTRLPMDLQALVSLRLWGRVAMVIQSEKFDRAFLTII